MTEHANHEDNENDETDRRKRKKRLATILGTLWPNLIVTVASDEFRHVIDLLLNR